jgi:hypothetical protein
MRPKRALQERPQKWGFFRARVPRPNRSPWTPATHIVLALAESRSGGCRTGAAQGAAPFASKVQVLLKAQLCDTAAGNVISALSQHSLITFGADHASMKPRRVGLRRSIPNCSKARSPSLFVIRSKGDAGHPRQPGKPSQSASAFERGESRARPVRILIDNT